GRRARDAERVGFLESVAADELRVHLAGDGDERDGIHQGIDEAGHEVGGAGARGGAANAGSAGGARIARGRERRVLLMPDEDVLDVRVVDRIVERQRHAAGIAEKYIDALT